MRSVLLLALLPVVAFGQGGLVPSIETDQTEYAYGETIELRYTLTNESSESFRLRSSSGGCTASFTFGSLVAPGESGVCTANEVSIDFGPGAFRTWVWQIIPSEHAVPETSGEQTITAYFPDEPGLEVSISITAPEHLGGRISLRLADDVSIEDVQDVMDALNAEIIDESAFLSSYIWEIEGTTVEDAIATYTADPRFASMEIWREIYPDSFGTTDAEDTPRNGVPALTTAYPNPFAVSTSFALTVPQAGPATVEVFDVLGRRVATLHDGPLTANVEHRFTFAASDLPSGLYIVRATGEGYAQARRITLRR